MPNDTSPTHELLDMDLASGDDDWQITPHGRCLAEVLAENNLVEGRSVLELGAGLGNHTILLLRQGARRLVATEIVGRLLDTTRQNVERNCPDAADRVEYRVADWLNTEGTYDLVITNPPFAKSGQRNRRYFIDSLILDAHKRLEPEGSLVFVQSSMADIAKTRQRLEENGYEVEVLGTREGPFRDYYLEDESFMEESRRVPDGFEVRDGVHWEKLYVVRARLRAWSPPAGAHVVEG